MAAQRQNPAYRPAKESPAPAGFFYCWYWGVWGRGVEVVGCSPCLCRYGTGPAPEPFERREHCVQLAGDLGRPGLGRMLIERLQAVARDDRHNRVVGRELPGGGKLLEHRDRGTAGGLGQDALGSRQQVDAREYLGVRG